ncbi:unnamed protein product [Didymodactylos carnosus]|uniref:Uncharacterized protein n=1 Tax=Didymodactylos carnosus TaxID=1234261 RepID=A0A815SG75_9BILA|nr:unnamed protein product [Didymodactylos carnosus]CAF1489736.1 unnamed protein product [Didymodactylos carnosus]CAF3842663.1 unnamed protein product [Didymodactylos carnosus]CAF4352947.1 unnamed protein product [Didymodactylos carnosus]
MSGIRCHECGATVTTTGAIARLAADGVKWAAETATNLAPDHIHIHMAAGIGLASGLPPVANNGPESGLLAEQYNARGYKCINDHSRKWVTAK